MDLPKFYSRLSETNNMILPCQLKAFEASNSLDQLCSLNINSKNLWPRRCCIFCTYGPSCRDVETLEKMIEAGMDMIRLNCTYADRQSLEEAIRNIRQAVDNVNNRIGLPHVVAIALETRGPEIRTGLLEGGFDVELKKGDAVKLTTDKAYMEKGNSTTIYIDYENILKIIQPEMKIFLDNGRICLQMTAKQGSSIICKVEKGGYIGGKRNCFLPGTPVDLPVISEKDIEDITFAIEHEVDFVIASGVRRGSDIVVIRQQFKDTMGGIKIIAKFEGHEGMGHINDIIRESDGILLYRTTLGIELPQEKLFLAEKNIIAKCNIKGKCVIVGKELLNSMIRDVRPTSAECLDIANIIIDGVDAVLLTNETATGLYPVECIKLIDGLAQEAEASIWKGYLLDDTEEILDLPLSASETLGLAAVQASIKCMAAAIIALTLTGFTPTAISKFNPRCPVIIVGDNKCTIRQLILCKAAWPLHFEDNEELENTPWSTKLKKRTKFGLAYGKALGFIKSGDPVVILFGSKPGAEFTDTLRVDYVSDIVKPLYY